MTFRVSSRADMRHAASVHNSELARAVAERLRASREELVHRWLSRIMDRVSMDANRIFPADDLLNHVPLLIDGIAEYVEHPERDLDAGAPVVAKAMELGALRHSQGFNAYEILKEYEILSAIVSSFLGEITEEVDIPASRTELFACWQRVSRAMELIRQATMNHYLRLSAEKVREREERLRRFNRMVSHELKNRVGAIRGAATLVPEPWLDDAQRERFHTMIVSNSAALQRVLENLEALSRLDADSRQQRNVLLPQAAKESARQLRDSAQSRNVEVRIAEDLPSVEVDAAAVELCLMNFISNAIKYSDPKAAKRWIQVSGDLRFGERDDGGGDLTVQVRDNGIGVPEYAREHLFEQFYRVNPETVTGIEGSGLGLSIVRDTVESLGGRAWAEFPAEGGSVFAFSLPSRREEDAAAAGTKRPDAT